MQTNETLKDEQLTGLINDNQKQDIEKDIDSIKQLALEKKYEDIKTLIAGLGKYKNLIDIEREIRGIKTQWDYHGISDEFYETLETFRSKISNKAEQYIPIGDIYEEYYQNIKHHDGISFINDKFDELTGGIKPGTICTIVGGPGSMKTTTAMNIAYNAIKDGFNVCYFSLEESPGVLYSKLLSRVSVDALIEPIEVSDILNMELSQKDKENLFSKVKPYLDSQPGKLFIVGETDVAQYSCFEFENKMREINNLVKERTKNIEDNKTHGIDLVVIDHVQLLKYASNGEDEFKTINKFISFFRRQSLSFLNEKREIAVMLLSQVNREGIKYALKHDGMYLMQHVAEASEIERASSYIISVYTDSMIQVSNQIKIGALKLRNAQLPVCTIVDVAEGSVYRVGLGLKKSRIYNKNEVLGLNSDVPIGGLMGIDF